MTKPTCRSQTLGAIVGDLGSGTNEPINKASIEETPLLALRQENERLREIIERLTKENDRNAQIAIAAMRKAELAQKERDEARSRALRGAAQRAEDWFYDPESDRITDTRLRDEILALIDTPDPANG